MGYLTWWSFPRKAWAIILAELGFIAFLSGWVCLQYLSDVYFQSYINSLEPVLVPILSIVFGICSASIATYLYVSMKKMKTIQEPEIHQRKKGQQEKKIMKRTTAPPSTETSIETQPQLPAKLRPLTPTHTSNRTHKQASKESAHTSPDEHLTTKKTVPDD